MVFLMSSFWNKQPVNQYGKEYKPGILTELQNIKVDNLPNLQNLNFINLDPFNDGDLNIIYLFLKNNYVGDKNCRLIYTKQTIFNMLTVPGYDNSLFIGLKDTEDNLKAFISGVPITTCIKDQKLKMCYVNFLCIHPGLRNQNLAPMMISKMIEKCKEKNISTAFYTAGKEITKPFCTKTYFHRPLNLKPLIKTGFFPPSTESYNLPVKKLKWEPLKKEDIPLLYAKLKDKKSHVHQDFTEEEVEHYFLKFAKSYIVKKDKKIKYFVSFYDTGLKLYNITINQGYLYDFFGENIDILFNDIIYLAYMLHYDVLNYLTTENDLLKKFKFAKGTGQLHYYFYNYNPGQISPEEIQLLPV